MLLKEAMEHLNNKFPFEVYKAPLKHNIDNCIYDTAYHGLFRNDTNRQVSTKTVTDRYVPHTTEDIKKIVTDCIMAFDSDVYGMLTGIKAWFNKGHYVCIAPPLDYRRQMHRGDTIYPRVHVYAPLGGAGSVLINCGFWREKCGNLAQPVCVKGIKLNFRHTSSLENNIENLNQEVLRNSWLTLKNRARDMDRSSHKFEDAMNVIFNEPTTARTKTRHTNRIAAIAKRIMDEREYHNQTGRHEGLNYISGWELYNGIQGYYQHDAPMRSATTQIAERRELIDNTAWIRMLKTSKNKHVIAAEELALTTSA
tara:strand:- start:128 stop:1057 length:930 start_codon:yes stop_codon:yes gene_type:complete